MDEGRVDREQTFHDDAFATDVRVRTWGFYTAVRHLFDSYRSRVLAGAGGRDVLEVGCGRGGQAVELAGAGDRVRAVDISTTAIEITHQEAARCGVDVETHQMDAHQLDFPDGAFDLVCGSGILHHLSLSTALGELSRVLRPEGRAVFLEPLGHNPMINLYRRRTPALRSPDERPLRWGDLRQFRRHFASVDAEYGGLLTLPLALTRRTQQSKAMRWAAAVEGATMRWVVPGLAAWFVVLDGRGAPQRVTSATQDPSVQARANAT